jgi:hypothetical protein
MALTTFSGPVVSQNGFLDSSFTTAERDAIVDPQPGLLIYNTTDNTYEVYNGTSWQPAFGPAIPPATYSLDVDYSSPGVSWIDNGGGVGYLNLFQANWFTTNWLVFANIAPDTPVIFTDVATGEQISAIKLGYFTYGAGGLPCYTASMQFITPPSSISGNVQQITTNP